MFIGHFAVALGVKRLAPEANLGTTVLAATFLDVVWPVFVAAGIEIVKIVPGNTEFTPLQFVSYPYSHSLAAAILWGALLALVYYGRRSLQRPAIWLALLVISHWFLDLIVHRPDLPVVPGVNMRVGFGLWNSVAGTVIVEALLFAVGLWLYLSATRARDRIGTWALYGWVALILATYAAAAFGPPPPNVAAIVIVDIVGTAVAVIWAAWADRHRMPVPART